MADGTGFETNKYHVVVGIVCVGVCVHACVDPDDLVSSVTGVAVSCTNMPCRV